MDIPGRLCNFVSVIKNTLNMNSLKTLWARVRSHRHEQQNQHHWLDSMSTRDRINLMARAHTIFFRDGNLINYEDIVGRWFRTFGFKVISVEAWISPYSVQSQCKVADPTCSQNITVFFTSKRVLG